MRADGGSGRGGAPAILVFDSGVGGLSVLAEIRALLPAANLIFASDNAAFPYGTKTEAELLPRVSEVIDRLVARFTPDVVVVACNTASTLALPALRGRLGVPVVGVVPAIKPAAMQSRSGVIGLLATPATVRRPYTDNLIAAYAAECIVRRLGSAELVDLAERKLRGERIDRAVVSGLIAPLFEGELGGRLDTIVLACTHFPLLGEELRAAAPRALAWIDSAPAVARRVKAVLEERGRSGAAESPHPRGIAVFTAETPSVAALIPALRRVGLDETAYL